jgi:hypothetical protein
MDQTDRKLLASAASPDPVASRRRRRDLPSAAATTSTPCTQPVIAPVVAAAFA